MNKKKSSLSIKVLLKQYILFHAIDISSSKILSSFLDEVDLSERPNSSPATNIYDLAILMDKQFSTQEKRNFGIFFTPRYIAQFMIDFSPPSIDHKCIDISCGSGIFLLLLVDKFSHIHSIPPNRSIENNIYGVDILQSNIETSRMLLHLYCCEQKVTLPRFDNLLLADGLGSEVADKFSIKFDRIYGNPPYIKYQDIPIKQREKYHKWEIVKSGNFNLLFLFFEQGFQLLSKGGVISYLSHNSYFTSQTGKSLRNFLQTRKALSHIIDFRSTKLFQAQAYTAISVLSNKVSNTLQYAGISKFDSIESFIQNPSFTAHSLPENSANKWRFFANKEHQQNINCIETQGYHLSELMHIKICIATLMDKVFCFIPSSENKHYYIHHNGMKIEKSATKIAVKISQIKSQSQLYLHNRRVLFPYESKNGSVRLINEQSFAKKFPFAYQYLSKYKTELLQRDNGKINPLMWYGFGRSQSLNNTGSKILFPTHSQKPRFLIDERDDSLYTNGYALYPKTNAHPLSKRLDLLQKVLNSGIMEYYIRHTSASLSGGHYCYQKNYLIKFSIPFINKKQLQELEECTSVQLQEWLMKFFNLPYSEVLKTDVLRYASR
jgi:adenine-specific DNA-methyltransferase